MREYSKKPQNQSHTLDCNPRASKQAPIADILQAYKNGTLGRQPIQRENVGDEELLQTKTSGQAPASVILQRYKDSIHRYASEEEDDLLQGKFETAQCEEIDEEELLQGKFDSTSTTEQEPLRREEKPNNTGLPDNLKTDIENLSGYSMNDVHVHYNSSKPAQLQALAYTQGTDIHVAPGQEQHLAHEAWHVVQQKQGRVQPTKQLQGVNVNDNEGLEKEADAIGGITQKKAGRKLYFVNSENDTIQKRKMRANDLTNQNHNLPDELINTILDRANSCRGWGLMFLLKETKEMADKFVEFSISLTNGIDNQEERTSMIQKITFILSENDPQVLKRIITEDTIQLPYVNQEGQKTSGNVSLSKVMLYLTNHDKKEMLECVGKMMAVISVEGITKVIEGAIINVSSSLIDIYPQDAVVDESISNLIMKRVKIMSEFIEKTVNDHPEWKGKYNIIPTGSDPHKGGEHAIYLNSVDKKGDMLYKPRSLQPDNALVGEDGMMAFLNSKMLPDEVLRGKALPTMHIDPSSKTESRIDKVGSKENPISFENAKLFYYKLGMIEVASVVMGVTDLHTENIIYTGEGPVIIDAECSFADYSGTMITSDNGPMFRKLDGTQTKDAPSLFYFRQEASIIDSVAGRDLLMPSFNEGKARIQNIILGNSKEFLEKYKQMVGNIDSIRIVPITTQGLATYMKSFNTGQTDTVYSAEEELKDELLKDKWVFYNILDYYKYENKIRIYLRESFAEGSIPSFTLDVQNAKILLNDYIIADINSKGILISNMMGKTKDKIKDMLASIIDPI